MTDRSPSGPLGIGLPVYNGEPYLADALESVLGQSFSDFELVISDNASTDGTAAIAREYAARDSRVRYHRNSENVGAARNFNRAFHLTSGRYFKWAAHDDLLESSYLERCIAALEADPGAVLAYPKAQIVDSEGRPLMEYDAALADDAPDSSTRFRSLLADHKCFQIFGVIRRDALGKTKLIGPHAHGDGVLLGHLALLGRFIRLPDVLFFPREHADQSMSMVGNYWRYAQWFDPELSGKRTFPHWRMFAEHARSVLTAPLTPEERLACLWALSETIQGKWRLLCGDALFHVRPKLVAVGVPERLLRRRSELDTRDG